MNGNFLFFFTSQANEIEMEKFYGAKKISSCIPFINISKETKYSPSARHRNNDENCEKEHHCNACKLHRAIHVIESLRFEISR